MFLYVNKRGELNEYGPLKNEKKLSAESVSVAFDSDLMAASIFVCAFFTELVSEFYVDVRPCRG